MSAPKSLINVTLLGSLRADAEGLTLYTKPDGSGYLIASSQGNSTYLVFDRKNNQLIGRFKINENTYDTVTGTDGIFGTSRSWVNIIQQVHLSRMIIKTMTMDSW